MKPEDRGWLNPIKPDLNPLSHILFEVSYTTLQKEVPVEKQMILDVL